MCATSAAAAVRRKYGKYLPHQRANVDQVPLPFVNDMTSRSMATAPTTAGCYSSRLPERRVHSWCG